LLLRLLLLPLLLLLLLLLPLCMVLRLTLPFNLNRFLPSPPVLFALPQSCVSLLLLAHGLFSALLPAMLKWCESTAERVVVRMVCMILGLGRWGLLRKGRAASLASVRVWLQLLHRLRRCVLLLLAGQTWALLPG